MVEVTYAIADDVKVKTLAGKDAAFADIKTGEAIQVHIDEVQFGKVGEKLQKRIEIRKIEVPNPTTKSDKTDKDKADPATETKKK